MPPPASVRAGLCTTSPLVFITFAAGKKYLKTVRKCPETTPLGRRTGAITVPPNSDEHDFVFVAGPLPSGIIGLEVMFFAKKKEHQKKRRKQESNNAIEVCASSARYRRQITHRPCRCYLSLSLSLSLSLVLSFFHTGPCVCVCVSVCVCLCVSCFAAQKKNTLGSSIGALPLSLSLSFYRCTGRILRFAGLLELRIVQLLFCFSTSHQVGIETVRISSPLIESFDGTS